MSTFDHNKSITFSSALCQADRQPWIGWLYEFSELMNILQESCQSSILSPQRRSSWLSVPVPLPWQPLASIGAAASHGLLIKGSKYLEALMASCHKFWLLWLGYPCQFFALVVLEVASANRPEITTAVETSKNTCCCGSSSGCCGTTEPRQPQSVPSLNGQPLQLALRGCWKRPP